MRVMDIFGVTNANNRAAIDLAAFKVLANLGIQMKNIPVKLNNARVNRNRVSCAKFLIWKPYQRTAVRLSSVAIAL